MKYRIKKETFKNGKSKYHAQEYRTDRVELDENSDELFVEILALLIMFTILLPFSIFVLLVPLWHSEKSFNRLDEAKAFINESKEKKKLKERKKIEKKIAKEGKKTEKIEIIATYE